MALAEQHQYLKIHQVGLDKSHWTAIADNIPKGDKLYQYAKGVSDGQYPGTTEDHRKYLGRRFWEKLGQDALYPYPYTKRGWFKTRESDPFPKREERIWQEVKFYAALETPAIFTQEDLRTRMNYFLPDHPESIDVDISWDSSKNSWMSKQRGTKTVGVYEEIPDYTQPSRGRVYGVESVQIGTREEEYSEWVRAGSKDLTKIAAYFKIDPGEVLAQSFGNLSQSLKEKVQADPKEYLYLLDKKIANQDVLIGVGDQTQEVIEVLKKAYQAHLKIEPFVYSKAGGRLLLTPSDSWTSPIGVPRGQRVRVTSTSYRNLYSFEQPLE